MHTQLNYIDPQPGRTKADYGTALLVALWLAVCLTSYTNGARRGAQKCLADIEVCRTIAGVSR